jgi:hypothetical protein
LRAVPEAITSFRMSSDHPGIGYPGPFHCAQRTLTFSLHSPGCFHCTGRPSGLGGDGARRTLAVSVAGGLAERKRPFSLLRLTGARLGMLRHVIVLESAVPLLAIAAVAIGTGFGASALYATMEIKLSLVSPNAAYYLMTAGGTILALALILATFPLLRRITGPETARSQVLHQTRAGSCRSASSGGDGRTRSSRRAWTTARPGWPGACGATPLSGHTRHSVNLSSENPRYQVQLTTGHRQPPFRLPRPFCAVPVRVLLLERYR